MEKLNFYNVSLEYVSYLKKEETKARGFSRVPNMDYGKERKQKFLCGVVLNVNNVNYYVPVSSYKQKKPDNFLILADNGKIISSLRFNYMFPIPKGISAVRNIASEPDRAYRALLSQELRYCINNQETIQHLAERTYKRVLLGKDKGLVENSCDFKMLEEKCLEYCGFQNENKPQTVAPPSLRYRVSAIECGQKESSPPPMGKAKDIEK